MEEENYNDFNDNKSDNHFYKDAANYWSKVPATVDGMLGGFGFISSTDIEGSEQFLRSIFKVFVNKKKTIYHFLFHIKIKKIIIYVFFRS